MRISKKALRLDEASNEYIQFVTDQLCAIDDVTSKKTLGKYANTARGHADFKKQKGTEVRKYGE